MASTPFLGLTPLDLLLPTTRKTFNISVKMDFKRLTSLCFYCFMILLMCITTPCLAGHWKWMKKAMKKYHDGPTTKFLGVKGIFIPVPMPIPIDIKKMMKW
ncbi:hypothetical protein NPIL_350031 [Nephila pilipes]|uniref:Transmembrane protein n=1 Tax=Nephila pilipes TaxID=299642 RepID=A0A8X6NNE7_NEPPI|nr:hypothetical protein NPIL_350031 [Nephila pilipes]